MKNFLLSIAFILFSSIISLAQNSESIYIGFSEEVNFQPNSNYKEQLISVNENFRELFYAYNFTVEKAIQLDEEQFDYLKRQAEKKNKSSESVARLQRILKINFTEISSDKLKQLQQSLTKFSEIRYVEIKEKNPIKPPSDIPPATPNYESLQNYLGPDPGVNMNYAFTMGLTGSGIKLKDVEYGVNIFHEELNEGKVAIAQNFDVHPAITEEYSEHGTAAIGVVIADRGTYGTTGMAYGTDEAILYPEYSVQYGYNRVEAVTAAINTSVEGDVIMYEMQTGGAETGNEDYVPAEYTNVIWDLTKAATDAGIVIVAAAGNGAQNLDSSIYSEYMSRGDSGAIIVGAGSPDTSHSKLQFSTFGSRVDVQAWGYNVYTTGYGDQAMVGNDFNQNYTAFSGTSSATPIVTSCVIVLQSYYHQLTGNYLSGIELRNILKTTGIPQGDFSGNIGPFPNMPNAISYINDNLATNNYIEEAKLLIFPNPFEDKITIRLPKSISGEKIIKLYDVKGRQILTSTMNSSAKTIATDNLANGVYFLHVYTSDKIFTKKIVK